MRWDLRTAAGLLVAVAVVTLTVLGAAVDVPWEVRERSLGLDSVNTTSDPPATELEDEAPDPPPPPEPLDLGWLRWVAWALVAAGALAAIGWFLRWLRDRSAAPRRVRAAVAATTDAADDPELPVLRRGVAEARRFLREVPGATDAIVAAWLALEEAAATSGVRRRPAQTPTEFTVEVLARTDADPDATRALLALYHRARFSGQPLHREDVEEAAAAFGRIAASWDALATGPVTDGGSP